MASHLYLYTMAFPYGRGEAFLEAEMDVLVQNFDKITIFPLRSSGEKRPMPDSIEVVDLFVESKDKARKKHQFSFFNKAKKNMAFLKDARYQWSYAGEIANKFEKTADYFKMNHSNGIHYSYWFEEWTLILSLLKEQDVIPAFVSRAHGFDLYEDRARLGYQPWRHWQFNNLQKVYSVSQSGVDYLRNKYPSFQEKIEKSYLGSIDFGLGNEDIQDVLQLVSCSNIIPLKRVDRIAKALGLISAKLHWTHIGAGVEMDKVKAEVEALPANISVTLTGSLPHNEVMNFYKNNPIDCFVNVSTTEGIPVAMMEALSFGIPIVATDVGGVKELVKATGRLINTDFTDAYLANTLLAMMEEERNRKNRAEENIHRQFWKNNFFAVDNYQDFCKRIIQEHAV